MSEQGAGEPLTAVDDDLPYGRDVAFWGMTTTQFFGAFNDNVFKQMLLMLCAAYVKQSDSAADTWQSIAQFAFALPFVLFSGYAGYLADRYSKRTIVVLCKVAEIVVMMLGAAVLLVLPGDSQAGLIALCGVIFLMGAQSAFFGPPKYGILPEMLRERDLPAANGLIQMSTFLAIIFGIVLGGWCVERFEQPWMVTVVCVGIAAVGTLTSLLLRRTPVAQDDLRFTRDTLAINRDTRTLLRNDRSLLVVLLISTLFWLVGGAVLPAVNGLGVYQLDLGTARTSVLAAMMGVGIAIGCPLAGVLSQGRVRFGMVRLGALGIFASLVLVGAAPALFSTISVIQWVCGFGLVMLGVFAGLFAVPLQVFLQTRPPKEQKGRMIGSMNLLNWIGILMSSVYHLVSTAVLGKGTSVTFYLLGAMMLPVALFWRPRSSESA